MQFFLKPSFPAIAPTWDFLPKEGVKFGTAAGLVVVDAVPNVGSFFDGFVEVSQGKNTPMLYCPVFNGDDHCEWFNAYWTDELIERFLKGNLAVSNLDRPKGLTKLTWAPTTNKEVFFKVFALGISGVLFV